jgi:dipeptide/tripeptide permease
MQVLLLVAILPLMMLSIVGNQQFNNAYPLWSQQYMDMAVGSVLVPVTWLQSVDATVSFLTMLGSIAFWKWCSERRREPDEMLKMALSCFVAAGVRARAGAGRGARARRLSSIRQPAPSHDGLECRELRRALVGPCPGDPGEGAPKG